MRVTLDPHDDVLLPLGRTLTELRPELARLTGTAAWRTAPVTLDGRRLPEDHVTGVPPWVAGTVLALADDLPRTAAPAPGEPVGPADEWHVVVMEGPDAGRTARPEPPTTSGRRSHRVILGRAPSSDGAARRSVTTLTLTDSLASRRHVAVGRRRRGWTVRDLGSANGTTLVAGDNRRLPGTARTLLPFVPVRARPGDALRLGASIVLLGGPPPRPGRAAALVRAARHPSVAVALAGGLLIAALTRNVVFLALALLAPVSALAARAGTSEPATDTDGGTPAQDGRGEGRPNDPLAGLPVVAGRPVVVDARTRLHPDHEATPVWWDLAREGLAVTGPDAVGVAHALALSALADPASRLTALLGSPGWAWLRWAEAPLAATSGAGGRVARTPSEAADALADLPDGPLLVLDVDGDAWRPQVHRWFATRRPGDAVVVVVPPGSSPPPWCRWTLRAGLATARPESAPGVPAPGEAGGSPVLTGPGLRREVVAPPLTPAQAESVARARAARWTADRTGPPAVAGWTDLGLPCDGDAVLEAWSRGGDLTAPLGLGDDGRRVVVDLRRDGPHALVAGTTGAGKSEMLQTLLLSLATTHAPHELAVVLVDYKGGAGFGECARLPHVTGMVTDLDAAGAARALAALRTELRRREHLLAAAGVTDLDALHRVSPDAPPRLLVLVDEFRALVEDLPDFVPGLVRVATQGRSLGVHLVLATQRPAGVVDAQLRANLPLRVCLRVTDRADSLDVVEVADAATIPSDRPGRALVHRPGAPLQAVQTAWAALSAADDVRWAPAWGGRTGAGDDGVRADPAAVGRLVDQVRSAHARTGRAVPEPPWLPPLPDVVRPDELTCPEAHAEVVDLRADLALPIALADHPELRSRSTLAWRPAAGALLVAGGPASGRTTSLRTVAHAALAAGVAVHVVAAGDRAGWVGATPLGGTVVAPDEPGRLARLLDRLLAGAGPPTVLVVDDAAAVQQALASLPRGAGEGLLDRVVREGRSRGLASAVAGTPLDVVRYLPQAALRLVLPLPDPHDARLLGVATAPVGPPGRARVGGAGGPARGAGVVRQAGDADREHTCQVAGGSRAPGAPAATSSVGAAPGVPVLVPLPRRARCDRPDVLGVGGDEAGPVAVPERSVLVVGPTRSGRSTALARLAAGHGHRGRRLVTSLGDALAVPRATLVLDDLDARLRRDPALDEDLARLVASPDGPIVLAAARTDRVAAAYRGALAALREETVLLLDPSHPGSGDVAGADVALHADPTARTPGRGLLVRHGHLVAVQVAR